MGAYKEASNFCSDTAEQQTANMSSKFQSFFYVLLGRSVMLKSGPWLKTLEILSHGWGHPCRCPGGSSAGLSRTSEFTEVALSQHWAGKDTVKALPPPADAVSSSPGWWADKEYESLHKLTGQLLGLIREERD